MKRIIQSKVSSGSRSAGDQIASPRPFVATVTTRLAINELRSARAGRERYVGEWLPEPIITDGHGSPGRQAKTADSLSLAMLVLLENLSPEQRAVLLLHDVLGAAASQGRTGSIIEIQALRALALAACGVAGHEARVHHRRQVLEQGRGSVRRAA